jgi:hypothetical protein
MSWPGLSGPRPAAHDETTDQDEPNHDGKRTTAMDPAGLCGNLLNPA